MSARYVTQVRPSRTHVPPAQTSPAPPGGLAVVPLPSLDRALRAHLYDGYIRWSGYLGLR